MYMKNGNMENRVSFVSLGPGDEAWVTVAARDALRVAEKVYCPSVEDRQGRRRSRAAELARALEIDPAKIICFDLAMREERTTAHTAYDQVFEWVRADYMAGLRVAVAVEGDVSIYASIHYVMDRLETAGVPVEQVAGIPSFIAAAAMARLSLVSQEEKLLVIPGHASAEELDRWLTEGCVVVLMKLSRQANALKEYLCEHPSYLYYYMENVATPEAICLTDVPAILARSFPYFSLLIIKTNNS